MAVTEWTSKNPRGSLGGGPFEFLASEYRPAQREPAPLRARFQLCEWQRETLRVGRFVKPGVGTQNERRRVPRATIRLTCGRQETERQSNLSEDTSYVSTRCCSLKAKMLYARSKGAAGARSQEQKFLPGGCWASQIYGI